MFMAVCKQLPPRLPKIPNQQWLTFWWPLFLGCGRAHVSVLFDNSGGQYIKNKQWNTNVNILRWTVAYLNATINSETRNTEPEIGTDCYSQTRVNLLVYGYGSGFGPPGGSRPRCRTRMEPKQPMFAVLTRSAGRLPRPVANTTRHWSVDSYRYTMLAASRMRRHGTSFMK